MQIPYKGKCKITKLFGTPPLTGITYRAGYHTGLDLVGIDSKDILACEAGTVTTVGYDSDGWGNYVKIKGMSGNTIIYCHLEIQTVVVGANVKEGDVIGREGATGQVTGRHLHLEFRVNGSDYQTAFNPCKALNIKEQLGEVALLTEFKTPEEVIDYWAEKGIINDPDFWKLALNYIKCFDKLLIKVANFYKED